MNGITGSAKWFRGLPDPIKPFGYNGRVATLSFTAARECVERELRAQPCERCTETVDLEQVPGRVLAEDIHADRDYPPLARSVRDGYAVRAQDVPGELRLAGEVRAGEQYRGRLEPGSAIEIMTGAPVPLGADAIVMVEHASRAGDRVRLDRPAKTGDFINSQAGECRQSEVVLPAGTLVDASHIAVLATLGCLSLQVYAKPGIAILATGDEVVPLEATPEPFQVRNSNACAVAAQVRTAGGDPWILPVAPDRYQETRDLIEQGLRSDLLLLSGGVSAGKYDIVERVLADLGAEFFFDRVAIQPGQPLVFGRTRSIFCFGLPGNPVSSMVTFRLFGALAVALLAGVREPALPLLQAPLTRPFRQKTGLTRFLPGRIDSQHRLTPLATQGSSDVFAAARANCFLVTDPEREAWDTGELIQVLLK